MFKFNQFGFVYTGILTGISFLFIAGSGYLAITHFNQNRANSVHESTNNMTKSSSKGTNPKFYSNANSIAIPSSKERHYDLDVTVHKSADIGKTQFPNLYGGVVLTNNGKHINVYLTKLSKKAEKVIRHGANSKLFTFRKTPHNKKQLLTIDHTVSQSAKILSSRGIHLVSHGPDVTTGKDEINVAKLTPSQKKYILKKFGESNVEVKNSSSLIILTKSSS
ncbi:hypothetical protein [Alicyclobacillus sp. SO9]|uniref:hypothetical protein n=1 Tax=Alicyclobacillus sp. SO9 TaxID=2665646 RepID=UPI0018E79097|nr:hypothetical protein [Alicyclobacillus sp. SO9]QQE79550.1 hypothetical protein GI364_03375 [Alicyclobacillus sp. SO9]